MKWFYAYDGDDFATRYPLTTSCSDPREVAEDAAEDFFNHKDGWECSWPLVIAVYESEGGPEVARFTVHCEAVPSFAAYEVR